MKETTRKGNRSPADQFNQSAPLARPPQSHDYGPTPPDEQPTAPLASLYAQQDPSPFLALPGNDKGRGQTIVDMTWASRACFPGSSLVAGTYEQRRLDSSSEHREHACRETPPVAGVGIVFSALGLRSCSQEGLATAGLMLSLPGLVLAAGMLLFSLAEVLSEI